MVKQPDDPGVDGPPPEEEESAAVGTFVVILLILYVLFFGSTAHAQVMRQFTIVCDLYVNNYRISWPPGVLSERECKTMLVDLEKKDGTKAQIQCRCTIGGRA